MYSASVHFSYKEDTSIGLFQTGGHSHTDLWLDMLLVSLSLQTSLAHASDPW